MAWLFPFLICLPISIMCYNFIVFVVFVVTLPNCCASGTYWQVEETFPFTSPMKWLLMGEKYIFLCLMPNKGRSSNRQANK